MHCPSWTCADGVRYSAEQIPGEATALLPCRLLESLENGAASLFLSASFSLAYVCVCVSPPFAPFLTRPHSASLPLSLFLHTQLRTTHTLRTNARQPRAGCCFANTPGRGRRTRWYLCQPHNHDVFQVHVSEGDGKGACRLSAADNNGRNGRNGTCRPTGIACMLSTSHGPASSAKCSTTTPACTPS